ARNKSPRLCMATLLILVLTTYACVWYGDFTDCQYACVWYGSAEGRSLERVVSADTLSDRVQLIVVSSRTPFGVGLKTGSAARSSARERLVVHESTVPAHGPGVAGRDRCDAIERAARRATDDGPSGAVPMHDGSVPILPGITDGPDVIGAA